ncbi:MAG TPA: T9SS type A sorting domain-containing protein [Bacteroidia bacterium]|nr:T9SS type A sorting domain-containing protein [Bacteroidia bacterium]
MKKIVTLFIACMTVITLSAQWNAVYTDPSKIYIDADFPTAQDGFVLGYYNSGSRFILKTTDGGLNWTEIALPLASFSQIAMCSATSGYVSAGGTPGVMVYTDDAFATVTVHTLDASYGTIGLDVISDSSGFYMNNDSHFRSFDDYGATYSVVMDTLFGQGSFDVADASTVYIGNGFYLEKSSDAGATWFRVNGNLSMYIGAAIAFINADTGYYLGMTSGIWQTIDGGISFQSVDSYYGNHMDAHEQFCASVFGLSTIRWSSDYGQNWTLEQLGMNNSNGVYLTPDGDCYVINSMTGEIRKRQMPLSVETTASPFSQVSVFPNPANDVITISFANGTMNPDARFTLVNTLGETVMEIQVPRDGRVSLTGLAAGMYSYQVWSDEVMLGTGVTLKGF